ncbi:MAG: hypothetical protein K6G03_07595 [Lachnospiraceae bacterium]|nr:hypothetical protein [Lachnospiraceae bacterium]
MYDFDSYLLYETKPRATLNLKLKVTLKEPVDADVLTESAQKAFRRFPYYRKKLTLDETGAHVFEPSDEDIAVIEESSDRITLGSEETNYFFFAITWEDHTIYFHTSHSICGACGMLMWVKSTLWQYLTDLHKTEIDPAGIMIPSTPVSVDEYAVPDLSKASTDDLIPVKGFGDAYMPIDDYKRYLKDPFSKVLFVPIILPEKDLIRYASANDGSPNSIVSALIFKTLMRVYKDRDVDFLSSAIVDNYRADVGCPNTYQDLVRMLRIKYNSNMADWPIKKLSTVTRGSMYLQMQPELSWIKLKKLMEFRDGIDAAKTHEAKVKYACDHSPIKNASKDTFIVSYVGRENWGGLVDYIDSAFLITDGHLLFELISVSGKLCLSFQQVIDDDKYLEAFLELLDEEHISYEVGSKEPKKLAKIQI